jgi:hypothetical protein
MKYLLLLLLLPFQSLAQNQAIQPKLDMKQSYEKALREYIKAHPDAIVSTDKGNVVFVKSASFTKELKDTAAGVTVKFVDPIADTKVLSDYLPKKKKFELLDLQQMVSRGPTNFIWIIPMKTTWSAHKLKLKEPEYEDTYCEYTYDFNVDHGSVTYIYKQSTCKNL